MTLQVRYCPQCGTRRTGYFRFCGRCGLDFDELTTRRPDELPLVSDKPEPTTPMWPPPVQWPPPDAQPTPEAAPPTPAVIPAPAVAPPAPAIAPPVSRAAAMPVAQVAAAAAPPAPPSAPSTSESPALGWPSRTSTDYVQPPAQRPILARGLASASANGTVVQPAPTPVERRPIITFTRVAIVVLATLLAVNAVSRAISQSPSTARTAAPTVGLASPLLVESPCPTVAPVVTPGPSFGPSPGTVFGVVTKVFDGDTIRVDINGTEFRVHYAGIDAPDPASTDPATKQMADEATATNVKMVEGHDVFLETDVSDKDQTARLLRDVWLTDSAGYVLVNHELVRLGWAKVDPADPNRRYADLLATAENSARAEKRGIWAAATPTCQ
jgi:endonuclease YncB( thermonuclease family)